ncbi:MAG: hypothetical protein JKY65_09055 [Planctomycetes bacterium]|nr:hypothetical protein [Planctomycetota bacterium]
MTGTLVSGAFLPLAINGLGASGYFLFATGLACAGLGIYFRKAGGKPPPAPAEKPKGKKNKKSKKNKKQAEHVKPQKAEGGSLIFGGLGFALIGAGMVIADLMR